MTRLSDLSMETLRREDEPSVPGFGELRDLAISCIQAQGSKWTDFNIHDPGVTLLEAILWSIVDLFYRTSVAPLGVPVVLRGSQPGHRVLDEAMLRRRRRFWFREWRQLQRRARQRGASGRCKPHDDAKVRWIGAARQRELEEAMRGYREQLEQLAGTRSFARLLDVWRRLTDASWGIDGNREDLLAQLGRLETLERDPAEFEDASGGSEIWPPHPAQLLSTQAVTAGDYGRRVVVAVSRDDVDQVWVVHGAVGDMRWDGTTGHDERALHPAAISILLRPRQHRTTAERTAVLERCRQAVLRQEVTRSSRVWGAQDVIDAERLAQVRKQQELAPTADSREDEPAAGIYDTLWSSRLLGDELYFGFAREAEIEISASVLVNRGADATDVRRQAHALVLGFLEGRAEDRDAHEDTCRSWIGPPDAWQRLKGGPERDAVPSVLESRPALGVWRPGHAVELEQVRARLLSHEAIIDVHDLCLRRRGGTWGERRVDLEPFEIPRLKQLSIQTRLMGGAE
ncbi:MAG: hypothetical protein ACE37K_03765 [Planctomycetota bacterium]